MTMQELEITIDNEGRVMVHVTGVKGEDCLSLTKNLETAVGDVLGNLDRLLIVV